MSKKIENISVNKYTPSSEVWLYNRINEIIAWINSQGEEKCNKCGSPFQHHHKINEADGKIYHTGCIPDKPQAQNISKETRDKLDSINFPPQAQESWEETVKNKIAGIVTYHGDDGTSGYAISTDQIDEIVGLLTSQKEERVRKVEKDNEWATREVMEADDTKWEIHYEGYKEAIRNVLALLKE